MQLHLVGGLEREVSSPLGAALRSLIICVESMLQCAMYGTALSNGVSTRSLRSLEPTTIGHASEGNESRTGASEEAIVKKQALVELTSRGIGMTQADAEVKKLPHFGKGFAK